MADEVYNPSTDTTPCAQLRLFQKAAIVREGRDLEDEFNAICESLGGDVDSRIAGDAYLLTTHALYHGGPIAWSFTPKIYTERGAEILRHASETCYGIMDKLTRAFRESAEVRALFDLDPDIEELAMLDTGYDVQIPIARVDIFLNEDNASFMFCEFNTDGSAGLTSAVEVAHAIERSETYGRFRDAHPDISTYDILEACADGIVSCWNEWSEANRGGWPENPTLAVVDYRESIVMDEIEHFFELFEERGISARFTDIRDLRVEVVDGQERLCDGEGPIDCVWRRVVLSEMLEKPCTGAEALKAAARENLMALIGGFRTWPCATKLSFAALHSPVCARYFTPCELDFIEAHIPYTEQLSPESNLSRFSNKDDWILKPKDGYNAVGVLAGLEADDDTWADALHEGCEKGFIIQAYAPQYASPVYIGGAEAATESPLDCRPAHNMEGLFLFNGSFGGVFTRCGFAPTIGEWTSRYNMGCFVVGPER